MKESKGIYAKDREFKKKRHYRDYHLYSNTVTIDIEKQHAAAKGRDFAVQYDTKKDNCTCKRTGRKKHGAVRLDAEHVSYYRRSRSLTNIAVGTSSVKVLTKKKVRRVHLPETDEKGVGKADVASYVNRKGKHSNYKENKTVASKCVGSFTVNKPEPPHPVRNDTKSAATSPRSSKIIVKQTKKEMTEMGTNTIAKDLKTAETQIEVEDVKDQKSMDIHPTPIIWKISNQSVTEVTTSELIVPASDEIELVSKDIVNDKSSHSIVQQVVDIESPDEVKPIATESKLENENGIGKGSTEMPSCSTEKDKTDSKAASLLRRFDALRSGFRKKEEGKRITETSIKAQPLRSDESHLDVFCTSVPPSLEEKSYSNVDYKCNACLTEDTSYKKANVELKDFKDWEQTIVKAFDDKYVSEVKDLFKLWGSKLNFEEDASTLGSSSFQWSSHIDDPQQHFKKKTQVSSLKRYKNNILESIQFIELPPPADDKTNGRNYQDKVYINYENEDGGHEKNNDGFFNKKYDKETERREIFKSTKQDVTAGRCEVKDGVMVQNARPKLPPLEEKDDLPKRKIDLESDYEEIMRKSWLSKYITARDSKNSVKVRWNNNTYTKSSSTVFELLENVCKESGVVFKSRSEMFSGGSYDTSWYTGKHSYMQHQNVSFMQNVEAWMVPTIVEQPFKKRPLSVCQRDMQMRVAKNKKWLYDKSQAIAQKIELVLHSNNLRLATAKPNRDYLWIDIPHGFFAESDDTTDDTPFYHTSDEEVYNVIEYDSLNTSSDSRKIERRDQGAGGESDLRVAMRRSNLLESLSKSLPLLKDAVVQGSTVFAPKQCDVIGVGIITQRDLKKPIIKVVEYETDDDESAKNVVLPQRKCGFAKIFLQDYYNHLSPIGTDLFSWCYSESHLVCNSVNTPVDVKSDGSKSKSCPNINDEYFKTTLPSCNASSCSQCCGGEYDRTLDVDNKKPNKQCKEKNCSCRVLPKDSIEVCKKRRLYTCGGNRTNWITETQDRAAQGIQNSSYQGRVMLENPTRKCNKMPLNYSGLSDDTARHLDETLPGLWNLKVGCPNCLKKQEIIMNKPHELPESQTVCMSDRKTTISDPKSKSQKEKTMKSCSTSSFQSPTKCFSPPSQAEEENSYYCDQTCQTPCSDQRISNAYLYSDYSPNLPGADEHPSPSITASPVRQKSCSPGPYHTQVTPTQVSVDQDPERCSPRSCETYLPPPPSPPLKPTKRSCPPSLPLQSDPQKFSCSPTNSGSYTTSNISMNRKPGVCSKCDRHLCTLSCLPKTSPKPNPFSKACGPLLSSACSPPPRPPSQSSPFPNQHSPTPLPPNSPPRPCYCPPSPLPKPCDCPPSFPSNSPPPTHSPPPQSPPPSIPCQCPPPTSKSCSCPPPPSSCQSPSKPSHRSGRAKDPIPQPRPTHPPPLLCQVHVSNPQLNASSFNLNKESNSSHPCYCQCDKCACSTERPTSGHSTSPDRRFEYRNISPQNLTGYVEDPYSQSLPVDKTNPPKIKYCLTSPCNDITIKPQKVKKIKRVRKAKTKPTNSYSQCYPEEQVCRSSNTSPFNNRGSPQEEPYSGFEYGRGLPETESENQNYEESQYLSPPELGAKNQDQARPARETLANFENFDDLLTKPTGLDETFLEQESPYGAPEHPTPLEKTNIYKEKESLEFKPDPVSCQSPLKGITASQYSGELLMKSSIKKATTRDSKLSTEGIGQSDSIPMKTHENVTIDLPQNYPKNKSGNSTEPSCPKVASQCVGRSSYSVSRAALYGEPKVKVVTPLTTDDSDKVKSKSNSSVGNTIEIQFKLKVRQGDKTTEISIGKDRDNKIKTIRDSPVSQDVYLMSDDPKIATMKDPLVSPPKNDININILIKNFKQNSGKRKSKNKKHDVDDYTRAISDKFQTVSAGQSLELIDRPIDTSNVTSIHRATIDLSRSYEKLNHQPEDIEPEGFERINNSPEVLQDENQEDNTERLQYENEDSYPNEDSNVAMISKESSKNTNTEHETRSSTESNIIMVTHCKDSAIRTSITDSDCDEPTSDVNNCLNQNVCFIRTSDETDSERIVKSNDDAKVSFKTFRDERKEMLQKVFDNVHFVKKPKKKSRIKKLKDMLKSILTSDSSGPEDMVVASHHIVRDMFSKLKPNFVTDINKLAKYRKYSGEWSDGDSNCRGCHSTQDCCCRERAKINTETTCDLKYEEYDTSAEVVDVQTQNSKYFETEFTNAAMQSSDLGFPFTSNLETSAEPSMYPVKVSMEPANIEEVISQDLTDQFGPQQRATQGIEMKALDTTLLGISDDDKIIFLDKKSTNIEESDVKIDTHKKRHHRHHHHKDSCCCSVSKPADTLQLYETKKAVLEIYSEKAGEHIVAKLPKFIYNKENQKNSSEGVAKNSCRRSICKHNFLMMSIGR